MNRILLVLSFLLLVTGFWAALPCGNVLFAVSGCCKLRDSYNARWRIDKGMTFEACKADNDRKDKDDVFEPSGFVWWDVQCR